MFHCFDIATAETIESRTDRCSGQGGHSLSGRHVAFAGEQLNWDHALGPLPLVRYIDVFEALSLEGRKVFDEPGRPSR